MNLLGSSQFSWLLFDSDLTPTGKNVLDGGVIHGTLSVVKCCCGVCMICDAMDLSALTVFLHFLFSFLLALEAGLKTTISCRISRRATFLSLLRLRRDSTDSNSQKPECIA